MLYTSPILKKHTHTLLLYLVWLQIYYYLSINLPHFVLPSQKQEKNGSTVLTVVQTRATPKQKVNVNIPLQFAGF